MTNKSTKKALLLSVLSMLICAAMLVGTTFAWFTDSVTSGKNTITAGNLDVELEYLTEEGWKTVEGATDLLDPEALWEPGHAEVVYLRISNLGTLALKYQFAMNIWNEVEGTNVAGKTFKLSKYLEYGVVDYTGEFKTREEAIAAVEDNAIALSDYSVLGDMEAGAPAKTVALVVYMPTTVGNEANYKTGTPAPYIELGVELRATQKVSEKDFFGNDYDANAPFSIWDGTVPAEMPETLVVDGATQTVHVKDAAAFAYLSTLSAKWAEFYTDGNGRTYTNYVNGAGTIYYSSGNWTVSLEADIDLNNHPIEPVSILFGESTGFTAFNGNGHTIRNISTTTGLFADRTRASYSNLVLENVKATNGALTGISDASITNVTVKNATVSGVDYVGGLAGKAYSTVKNCKVINSSVTATGKEAGGLIGYAETNSAGSTITNNTVKNVSVSANNRAAGLVAQPNVNIKVYDNTVDTVTVGAEDLTKYAAGAVVSNALAPENVYDNTVVNATIIGSLAIVEDASSLKDALREGTEFINANGANLGALNYGLNTTNVPAGKTVTIANADFEGKSYGNGVNGTVVFENCTFTNSGAYSIHFDNGSGYVVFKNCVLEGWCSFGSAIKGVTMENCTLRGNGKYAMNRFYQKATLTNCVIDCSNTDTTDKYFDGISAVGADVELVDCELVCCDYEIADGGTIKIDGIAVVTDDVDMKAAIDNGETTLYLADGEYDLNGNQKDGLTFIGLGNEAKVANTTKYASGKSTGAIWKAINLKNVTVTNTVYTMADGGNATFENVNFAAGVREAYGKNVKFDGCSFGSNAEGYALHFQTDSTDADGEIKLNGCAFLGGKVHLGGKRAYTFTGCDFEAGTDFQVWSNITLDGCTVAGVEVNADNITTLFPKLDTTKVTIK